MNKFEFWTYRDNLPRKTLDVLSATIDSSVETEIRRSMNIEILDIEDIDIFRDEIKVINKVTESSPITWGVIRYYSKTWEEIRSYSMSWQDIRRTTADVENTYDWGIFLPTTPVENNIDGVSTYRIECYDRSLILKEYGITTPYYIPAGTKYTDAIQELLISANITLTNVVKSDKMLPIDAEYEIGTKKLEIINSLCAAINYDNLYFDASGVAIVKPFEVPTLTTSTRILQPIGNKSLIAGYNKTTDIYKIPNVFVAVVSNSDLETPLISRYTNSNASSPFSTVSRGRIITSEVYKPDDIASQETLDAWLSRQAFLAYQVYESVEIETTILNDFEAGETVLINNQNVSGIHQNLSWSAAVFPQGSIRHRARKLVTAW